jgi:hypothetical protein
VYTLIYTIDEELKYKHFSKSLFTNEVPKGRKLQIKMAFFCMSSNTAKPVVVKPCLGKKKRKKKIYVDFGDKQMSHTWFNEKM